MGQLHQVEKPIICEPYKEPTRHYVIEPGRPIQLAEGRRRAMYYYRPPERQTAPSPADDVGTAVDLPLVNELRDRVREWRNAKPRWPGASRTTRELLEYWHREEREGTRRLFFCQREAVETILFLIEAREDMRQGLNVPRDEPSDDAKDKGYAGFLRYACKMATGTGNTTVMAMVAAWSI